jgi:hypothetical protein
MVRKRLADTAIECALTKFKKKYPISSDSIRVPMYDGLTGDIPEKNIVHFSGYCFELLSQAIFGNNHHNGGIFELEYGGATFQPDLFNSSGDLAETKSCNWRMQLKLIRKQMAGYATYAVKNPDKEVDFCFHSHSIEKMKKRRMSRGEYVEEFPNSVCFSIKTPLVIPMCFYLNKSCTTKNGLKLKLNEYDAESSGKRGYRTSGTLSISSLFLPMLLHQTEETLEALHLNPDNFSFEKYIIEGIKFNKKEIQPFPLLEIKQKSRLDWVNDSRASLEHMIETSEVSEVKLPGEKTETQLLDEQGKFYEKHDEDEDQVSFGEEAYESNNSPEENDEVPF